jgi:hypothetical protein
MPSAAKIQASRLNGAKSRGPITAQGKKKSSLNALKPGLTAKTAALCNEAHSLFEKLQQSYIDSLQPTSALELELIHRLVAAEWSLRRVWTVGTALADADMLLNRPTDETENIDLSTTARNPPGNSLFQNRTQARRRPKTRKTRPTSSLRPRKKFHLNRPQEVTPRNVDRAATARDRCSGVDPIATARFTIKFGNIGHFIHLLATIGYMDAVANRRCSWQVVKEK